MIRTEKGRLYTGITNDLARRFLEHKGDPGGRGAKFFRADRPLAVVYTEVFPDRSEASQREWAIKRLPRTDKEALIASAGPAKPVAG